MKKVIISGYWTIAVLLISLVVLSLGYTFPESLFIAATFLPGAFFSLYFPERISRSGSVKDTLYVVAGILVVEISLILSAHFVILEMRNDFNAGVDSTKFCSKITLYCTKLHIFYAVQIVF